MDELEALAHLHTNAGPANQGGQRHSGDQDPRIRVGVITTDPKTAHYDRDETVYYQIRQLPPESVFSSSDWEDIFAPFHPSKPVVERRNHALGPPDLTWKIGQPARLNGAYVDYDEFGYDEAGYVCKLEPGRSPAAAGTACVDGPPCRSEDGGLQREIKEHIVSFPSASLMPDNGSARPTSCWAGQRFGREWKFGLNGVCDDTLFSIAALQLCREADLDETGPLGLSRQRLTKCFLEQFRGEWKLSRNLWGSSDHRWAGSARFDKPKWEDLVFQYHMRVFTAPISWMRHSGRSLKRVSGTLTSDKHKRSLDIYEVRYSVGLKTTWRFDLPVFSLVTMADSVTASRLQDLGHLWSRNEWETAGIHPSVRATGLAAFAFRIQSLLPQWEAQWSNLIDEIGKVLNNDILRLAADWIQESMDDLCQTVKDIERLYLPRTADQIATFFPAESDGDTRDAAIEVFKQNWETVILHQQRVGTALLYRIAMKQEECKSLRDGLFNATSVNEATKSTQLNHYILVFAMVTIFYLPLSFITVYPKQVIWFAVTIILVAGATYLFSWLSIWVVQGPAERGTFAEAYARLDRRLVLNWILLKLPGGWKRDGTGAAALRY
ncbi:hypothetical protein B0T25DRAFT_447397 [Lasiosphaeria hispida]|uniref:Uncharacterized protein n=1 Tax=Lasiosphaeria hispida TaxID=260671 RepID=A0AAJ0HQC5_9PEZI|nr:hypothetical protein B0T25DRAFT_447397 [Lasiosphaeria hispida]